MAGGSDGVTWAPGIRTCPNGEQQRQSHSLGDTVHTVDHFTHIARPLQRAASTTIRELPSEASTIVRIALPTTFPSQGISTTISRSRPPRL